MPLFTIYIYNSEHKQSGLFNFTIFSLQDPACHRFQWLSRNSLNKVESQKYNIQSLIKALYYIEVILQKGLRAFQCPSNSIKYLFTHNLFIFRLGDYTTHKETRLQNQISNLLFFSVSQNPLPMQQLLPHFICLQDKLPIYPGLFSIQHLVITCITQASRQQNKCA